MRFIILAVISLTGILLFSAVSFVMYRCYNRKAHRSVSVIKMRNSAVENYVSGLPYFEHEYRSKYPFMTSYIMNNSSFVGFAPMALIQRSKITHAAKNDQALVRLEKEFMAAPKELVDLYTKAVVTTALFAKAERPARYLVLYVQQLLHRSNGSKKEAETDIVSRLRPSGASVFVQASA